MNKQEVEASLVIDVETISWSELMHKASLHDVTITALSVIVHESGGSIELNDRSLRDFFKERKCQARWTRGAHRGSR
jgi:hypothetical protein